MGAWFQAPSWEEIKGWVRWHDRERISNGILTSRICQNPFVFVPLHLLYRCHPGDPPFQLPFLVQSIFTNASISEGI